MFTNLFSFGVVNTGQIFGGVGIPAGYFFGLAAFTIFMVILLVLMLSGRTFHRASMTHQLATIKAAATQHDELLMNAIRGGSERTAKVPAYAQEYVPREASDDRDLVLQAFRRRESW